jgi:hypothetical protein
MEKTNEKHHSYYIEMILDEVSLTLGVKMSRKTLLPVIVGAQILTVGEDFCP